MNRYSFWENVRRFLGICLVAVVAVFTLNYLWDNGLKQGVNWLSGLRVVSTSDNNDNQYDYPRSSVNNYYNTYESPADSLKNSDELTDPDSSVPVPGKVKMTANLGECFDSAYAFPRIYIDVTGLGYYSWYNAETKYSSETNYHYLDGDSFQTDSKGRGSYWVSCDYKNGMTHVIDEFGRQLKSIQLVVTGKM
jgi:hypothetical protein